MASKLKITQVRSAIRQTSRQKRTLEALGLRRMHQTVLHNDTPQIRGMVEKVSHLVSMEVEAVSKSSRKKAVDTAAASEVVQDVAEEKSEDKKAAKKPAAAKKTAAKKTAAKKTAAKKTAAKKTSRSTAAKKTAKKSTARKSAAKKSGGGGPDGSGD